MGFGKQVGETGTLRHEKLFAGTLLLMLTINMFQKISRLSSTPLPKILLSNGSLENYRAC